jgi:hypothetical protein
MKLSLLIWGLAATLCVVSLAGAQHGLLDARVLGVRVYADDSRRCACAGGLLQEDLWSPTGRQIQRTRFRGDHVELW